jgi:hypothetical protein
MGTENIKSQKNSNIESKENITSNESFSESIYNNNL